jgi:HK97 family phage prohead protease
MDIIHKYCEKAGLQLSDSGSGSLSGYASTFGNRDRAGDVIVPGAFKKSLEAFKRDGFIAVGHDWGALPVATVMSADEDEYGLKITADFHSTPEAQAARTVARERITRGKSVGLSIGFVIKEAEDIKDGRVIKEVELFETSLVTVPCNPLASAVGIKGFSLHDGLTFADHSEAVRAAVEEFAARVKDLSDLRLKEGRVLSELNRTRIKSVLEVLDGLDTIKGALNELLVLSEPKTKAVESDEIARLYREFLQIGL